VTSLWRASSSLSCSRGVQFYFLYFYIFRIFRPLRAINRNTSLYICRTRQLNACKVRRTCGEWRRRTYGEQSEAVYFFIFCNIFDCDSVKQRKQINTNLFFYFFVHLGTVSDDGYIYKQ